jgi:hypothetical protein
MARKDTIGRHVLRAALKFEGEYSLATCLEMENRDKGVAPNTGLVLRHLRNTQEKNRVAISADADGIYNFWWPEVGAAILASLETATRSFSGSRAHSSRRAP